jgi:hypothetical protein
MGTKACASYSNCTQHHLWWGATWALEQFLVSATFLQSLLYIHDSMCLETTLPTPCPIASRVNLCTVSNPLFNAIMGLCNNVDESLQFWWWGCIGCGNFAPGCRQAHNKLSSFHCHEWCWKSFGRTMYDSHLHI